MYDFDIFKFDTSIVGLSAGALFLAKLFFSSRKIKSELKRENA